MVTSVSINIQYIFERAINEIVNHICNDILNDFTGDLKTYKSIDSLENDEDTIKS